MAKYFNPKNSRKNEFLLLIVCLLIFTGFSSAGTNDKEFPVLTSQTLKLSGFTQVRYAYQEEDINGFRIKRARLALQGNILKKINYTLQIDTVKSPILLDAKIEISVIPQATLTLGQFKVPFSIENLTSSSALDTINRSKTVENLCPGRDIGAQGRDIGVIVQGQFLKTEYTFGVFNGSGINKNDDNNIKDIAGRLVFYPADFLRLGLSLYNGKHSSHPGASGVKRVRTGVDISLTQGQLSLKGEYIFGKDDQTDKYGWYLQGGYYLIPEKIQPIVKYDSFNSDKNIQGNRIEVITLGLNWFFSKKTKFQINYELHKENPKKTSKNVILAQLQAGF